MANVDGEQPQHRWLLQVVEAELHQLFGSCPGFQQVKLNRGPRGVTCFVEFNDVASAMAVHQQHQVPSLLPVAGCLVQRHAMHVALSMERPPSASPCFAGRGAGILGSRRHPHRVQQEPIGAQAGLWRLWIPNSTSKLPQQHPEQRRLHCCALSATAGAARDGRAASGYCRRASGCGGGACGGEEAAGAGRRSSGAGHGASCG